MSDAESGRMSGFRGNKLGRSLRRTPVWHQLPLFLLCLGIARPSISTAQEITVRLLDCRTGVPYADKIVTFGFFHPENTAEPPKLRAKTAVDGTAVFHVSETLPAQAMVFPGTGKDLYPCSSLLPIDMRQVSTEGIVSRCSKKFQGCRCKFGKATSDIANRPGQLVLFARPITRGERFRWSIWGD